MRHLLQEERHGPVLHAASGSERPAGSERVLPGWHVVRQGRRSELLLHAESMCSRSKVFNSFILGLNFERLSDRLTLILMKTFQLDWTF